MCSWKAGFHSWRVVGRRNFSPFTWYNKQLEGSPIITKSITSGSKWASYVYTHLRVVSENHQEGAVWKINFCSVLFGSGDVIAQVIIGGKDVAYDGTRTGRACVFGTFVFGPLAHLHFYFLEWLVVRKVTMVYNAQTHL